MNSQRLVLLVVLIIGTFAFLIPYSIGVERTIEIAQTASEFIYSTANPVYLVDDIPQEYNPDKKRVLHNGIHKDLDEDEIKIVSWNILRNYHEEEIRSSLFHIIEEHGPTILLIQEAPVYEDHAFWEDSLFSDFNVVYAPLHQVKKQTPFYNFIHSGQLILSAYPFTKTENYQLPSVSRQVLQDNHVVKRLALYAQVTTEDGRTVGIYNVHLENAAWQSGREKQLAFLLDIIDQNNDDIVLIGGDFNTFLGHLEQGITSLETEGFTMLFNEFRLTPRLDHLSLKGTSGSGVQLEGSGSDHQPVMAVVYLGE